MKPLSEVQRINLHSLGYVTERSPLMAGDKVTLSDGTTLPGGLDSETIYNLEATNKPNQFKVNEHP